MLEEPQYDLGTNFTDYNKPDEKNNELIKRRSKLGIIFIIIGFILQFIANWI
jgi:hypothetical protein